MRRHSLTAYTAPGVVLLSFLLGSANPARAGQGVSPPGQVPDWLAWKAFQDTLAASATESPQQLTLQLLTQFGLTPPDVDAVLSAGSAFSSAIGEIDADVRRDPKLRGSRLGGPGQRWIRGSGTAGRSLPGPAVAEGIRTAIDQRKQRVLSDHLRSLESAIGQAKLTRLADWVHTAVAANIKSLSRPAGR